MATEIESNTSVLKSQPFTGLTPALSGGRKHMWLMQHRQLVLDYYAEFGEKPTCERFQLGPATLYRLVYSKTWNKRPPMPDKIERALIKSDIALQAVRNLTNKLGSKPGKTTVMICQLPTGDILTLIERALLDSGGVNNAV